MRLRTYQIVALTVVLAAVAFIAGLKVRAGTAAPAPGPAQAASSDAAEAEGDACCPPLPATERNTGAPPKTPTGSGLPCLVEFEAEAPEDCQLMEEVLKEVAVELAGRIDVVVIDTDLYPEEATRWRLRLVPTQIVLDAEGEELWRHEGYVSAQELLARLDTLSPVDPRPGQLDLYVSDAYAHALHDLMALFRKKRPNVSFRKRVGSTRVLVQDIVDGTKADVFLSAGDIEARPLEKAGLVGLCKDFCFVSLGIITPQGNPSGVHSLADLAADTTKAVALGPADTSIGQYAVKLLNDQGLWAKVETKAVVAGNPSDVLDLVAKGKADACLAYGAALRGQAAHNGAMRTKLQLVGDLTAEYCLKIPCPAISPTGCAHPELAREFVDFLTSDGAQEVLARHGFLRLRDPCRSAE